MISSGFSRVDRRPVHRRPLVGICAVATCCVLCATGSLPAAEYPPSAGTDRESAAYLDAVETYLQNLDLDDADLEFERLGGTTATNWSVKKDGQTVADLKCTSGNTNHHGAVIAYRLGRELGFNIYPVAVYLDIDLAIDGRRFKEQCALKEWSTVFTQYYWTRETFTNTDSRAKRELIGALKCGHSKPEENDAFEFYAKSAYGDPKIPGERRVEYRGDTRLLNAAKDFSNMMVIDTLIGNEDRFPGGNTFFRSVTTNADEFQGGFKFENVRIFSLDNEAAFKGRGPASTHSARDLTQQVSRFDDDMIAKLRRLAADADTLDRLTDGHEELAAFVREGVQVVFDHVATMQEKCGEEATAF